MQANKSLFQWIAALFTEESGQDGIEYLLVVGGISVAVVVAAVALKVAVPGVITGVCKAIATIPSMSSVSC